MTATIPMNRRQAEALFERYSVLVGDRDALPLVNAVDLLGKENIRAAVNFCKSSDPSKVAGVRMCGNGRYQLHYIGFKEYMAAVTFANVEFFKEGLDDKFLE